MNMAEDKDNPDRLSSVVNNLLSSDDFRRSLENALRNSVSNRQVNNPESPVTNTHNSGNNAICNSTSVSHASSSRSVGNRIQSEVSRLFRPHITIQRPSKRKLKENNIKTFHKEFLLLKNPNSSKVIAGKERALAAKEGRVILSKICKTWSEDKVRAHIRSLFAKFLSNSESDILFPIHKDLVKPHIEPGEDLNAENLHRVTRMKPVYIRPSTKLSNVSLSSEDEEDMGTFSSEDFENSVNDIQNVTHTVNQSPPLNYDDSIYEFEDDLNKAIANSLSDTHTSSSDLLVSSTLDSSLNSVNLKATYSPVTNLPTDSSPQLQLQNFVEQNCLQEIVTFNVIRESIFNCALITLKRPSFCGLRKPHILFTDDYGNPEGAIDAGGPKREFFRLILSEIKDSPLFEGPDHYKQITLRSDALQDSLYFHSVVLIGMSIIHGGPSPSFFSENFFNCLVGIESQMDICNYEIMDEIKKIEDAADLSQLNEVVGGENYYLSAAGCPTYLCDFSKKETVLKGILDFYSVYRNKPALEQFIKGLESLKIFEFIKHNYSMFKNIFCVQEKCFTAEDLDKMFTISFSEAGSNKRRAENRTLMFFRNFLIDCQEKLSDVTLEDILMFASGTDSIPPLGFVEKPTIEFKHDNATLPTANTCAIILYLPTCHETYDSFKEKFSLIKDGMVFGYE